MDDDDVRNRREQRNGHEALQRIVGDPGVQMRIGEQRHRAHHERVAVRRGFGGRFPADIARSAEPWVRHDLLAQYRRKLPADHAPDQLGAAGERQNHSYRFCGIRRRRLRKRDGDRKRKQQR